MQALQGDLEVFGVRPRLRPVGRHKLGQLGLQRPDRRLLDGCGFFFRQPVKASLRENE